MQVKKETKNVIPGMLARAKLKALPDGQRRVALEFAIMMSPHDAAALPAPVKAGYKEISATGAKFNMVCIEPGAVEAQEICFFRQPEDAKPELKMAACAPETVTVEKEQGVVLLRFTVNRALDSDVWRWLEANFGKRVWMAMKPSQMELAVEAEKPKAKAAGEE